MCVLIFSLIFFLTILKSKHAPHGNQPRVDGASVFYFLLILNKVLPTYLPTYLPLAILKFRELLFHIIH